MIKILFLFFLLLNALYFYTQFVDTGELASSTILKQSPLPQGVDKLVLLREHGLGEGNAPFPEKPPGKPLAQKITRTLPERSVETRAKKPGVQEEGEPDGPICLSLGPFARVDAVKGSSRALAALGVGFKPREVSRRTPRGYWVYLPASKSYQAAKRKVTELQKKGLKDLFIMGKGNHRNAISLGLFTREKAANSRFQQVKKLGLKAVLETQYRVNKQTWLDITVLAGQTATMTGVTKMADALQQAGLVQRKCQ